MASLQPRQTQSHRPHQHWQPKAFKLTLRDLLAFPYRMCNPPQPTVGKVRSCGVTPVYKVKLDDILDRKHLPPLGLKDFEEWLLYVEQSPENLYFMLWLREYTQKYNQFALESRNVPRINAGQYRVTWPAPSSSTLQMSYARAKQTFFTPNSDYELNVPSDILTPFHTPSFGIPHPDPAVFNEVSSDVQKMLQESLDRLVVATYTNVGNGRGLCGILGGVFITLLGSIAPIVCNILSGRSRWLRLTALPGLWVGLTIILTSLHGVCMMVYIFGDLRQLRKFEMARPPISRPQPLSNPRNRPVISEPISVPSAITRPPRLSIIASSSPPANSLASPLSPTPTLAAPTPIHVHDHKSVTCTTPTSPSSNSINDTSSIISSSSFSTDGDGRGIHISSVCYQDESPQSSSRPTSPTDIATHSFPPSKSGAATPYTITASFIHPYDSFCDDDYFESGHGPAPQDRQHVSAFDFDALPPRTHPLPAPSPPAPAAPLPPVAEEPCLAQRRLTLVPRALLLYVQGKCIARLTHRPAALDLEKGGGTPQSQPRYTRPRPAPKAVVREHYHKVQAVPAFASPFTRILSPVVTRAQWEIVVRSAAIAVVLSWCVLGCLLAVPEKR